MPIKLVNAEEQLKDRLNQRFATRVDVLRQMQASVKLEPHALEELRQSEIASMTGQSAAEKSRSNDETGKS